MQITNRYQLPDAYVNWAKADAAERSNMDTGDISVTELLSPIRQTVLKKKHYEDISVDVSDMIKQLTGIGVHSQLSKHADPSATVEERIGLTFNIEGYPTVRITGQYDHYKAGVLTDYKTSSIFKYKNGVPLDVQFQLNLYAYLKTITSGKPVHSLQVIVQFNDWMASRAGTNHYPSCPVESYDVELWSVEEQRQFLEMRLAKYLAGKTKLPECSDSERWLRDEKYAVMIPEKEKAKRLFDTAEEATNWIADPDMKFTKAIKDSLYVQHRAGTYMRCEKYCEASRFCTQHNTQLKEALE
jgi:hypothetical protein